MNSPLPSRSEAWSRLRRAEPAAWVLEHVACVEALAVAMADRAAGEGRAVDRDLVQVGAVLHDIGRSVTQDPSHAHRGAEILRAEGVDPALVRVVERHTGAGVLPDDAQRIGIPRQDYTPRSLEERIVAHADNLYSGNKRLRLEQVVAKYDAKGLHQAGARIVALHEELTLLLGEDPERIRPAGLAPA